MNALKVLYLDNLKRMITKRRKYFLIMLFAPIIMLVIFSYVFTSNSSTSIKVGIINEGETISSQVVINTLKENKSVNIINIKENNIKIDLNNKTIDLAVIIPSNLDKNILSGKSSGIKIETINGNNYYSAIKPLINSTLTNLGYLAKASQDNITKYKDAVNSYITKGVNIKESNLSDIKSNYGGIREFLGILMFFIFAMAIAGTKIIGDARKNNVYARAFMAPVNKAQYFLANIFSSLTVLIIQIAVSLGTLKYIVKLNLGISNLELSIVLLAIGAFAISLELLSMLLSKDDSAMLSNIIIWVLAMLGGLFVPVELFPKAINNISMFLPTRWAMQYIYNIQQGIALSSSLKYIIYILIVTAVLFIIAAFFAAKESNSFKEL